MKPLTKKQLSLELYDKFGEYPSLRKWGVRYTLAHFPKMKGLVRGQDAIKCMAVPGFIGWAEGPVYETVSQIEKGDYHGDE